MSSEYSETTQHKQLGGDFPISAHYQYKRRPVYSIAGRLLLLLLVATIVLWGHAGGQNARRVRVCKCY